MAEPHEDDLENVDPISSDPQAWQTGWWWRVPFALTLVILIYGIQAAREFLECMRDFLVRGKRYANQSVLQSLHEEFALYFARLRSGWWWWRLPTAIVIAAAVFSVGAIAAWLEFAGDVRWRGDQLTTRAILGRFHDEFNAYHGKSGKFPLTLEALRSNPDFNLAPMDGWDYPLVYSMTDGAYQLESLGQDGQPGGSGLNADLTGENRELQKKRTFLTFSQFASSRPGRLLLFDCALAALISAAVALRAGYSVSARGTSFGVWLVTMSITCLGAAMVAMILGILHIPNNH